MNMNCDNVFPSWSWWKKKKKVFKNSNIKAHKTSTTPELRSIQRMSILSPPLRFPSKCVPFPNQQCSSPASLLNSFTVLQLNTLGRSSNEEDPIDVSIARQASLLRHLCAVQPSIAALQEVVPSSVESLREIVRGGGRGHVGEAAGENETPDVSFSEAMTLEGRALNIVDAFIQEQGLATTDTAADANDSDVKQQHESCHSSPIRRRYECVAHAKETERSDLGCVLFDTNKFELVSQEQFKFGNGASQFAIILVLRLKQLQLPQHQEEQQHDSIVSSDGSVNGGGASPPPHPPHASTRGLLLVAAQHAKAGRSEACEAIRLQHTRMLLEYLSTGVALVGASSSTSSASPSSSSSSLYPFLVREGKLILLGDMNAGPPTAFGDAEGDPSRWYRAVVEGEGKGEKKKGEEGASDEWVNRDVPLFSTMTAAHRYDAAADIRGGDGGVGDSSAACPRSADLEPLFTTFKMKKPHHLRKEAEERERKGIATASDGNSATAPPPVISKFIRQAIDYIFISKNSKYLLLKGVNSPDRVFDCSSFSTTQTETVGGDFNSGAPLFPLPPGGFPSCDGRGGESPLFEWGSDHLPLLCEIEYAE